MDYDRDKVDEMVLALLAEYAHVLMFLLTSDGRKLRQIEKAAMSGGLLVNAGNHLRSTHLRVQYHRPSEA